MWSLLAEGPHASELCRPLPARFGCSSVTGWYPARLAGEAGEGEAAADAARVHPRAAGGDRDAIAGAPRLTVHGEVSLDHLEFLGHRVVPGSGTRPAGREAHVRAEGAV